MGEKRFERWNDHSCKVKDNQEYTFLNWEDVVNKLNEQQATIRKLQDLCGESDGENAKLRLKSKELQEEIKLLKPTNIEQYEQIVQLQKENEQLKRKLKDCEHEHFLDGLGSSNKWFGMGGF